MSLSAVPAWAGPPLRGRRLRGYRDAAADHVDAERPRPPANVDLALFGRREVEAGELCGGFGNDQVGIEFLGRGLQPAADIDGVADRGDAHRRAEAHGADDGRADMDADRDMDGAADLAGQFVAQPRRSGDDGARRRKRLAARLAGRGLEAEQRHRAVADELVEPAAGLLDRLADDREIAVEQEHDVERQALVGDAR